MKKEKIGVGMFIGWHVHGPDFVKRIAANENCALTYICDADADRGRKLADEYGCSYTSDYSDLLRDQSTDGVVLCTETVRHYEQILAAAEAGKHIYVEKAPFVTTEEAMHAKEVLSGRQVIFFYSNPIQQPHALMAKKIVDDGLIGDITGIRIRASHSSGINGKLSDNFFKKEESGGGVFLDLGYKCVQTLEWFLGMPIGVFGRFEQYSERARQFGVEDQAVCVYSFPGGQYGIAEASWSASRVSNAADFFGTQGVVHIQGHSVSYCQEGEDWIYLPEDSYPGWVHPLDDWVSHVKEGKPLDYNTIDEAVLCTRMISAAYASASSGRWQKL